MAPFTFLNTKMSPFFKNNLNVLKINYFYNLNFFGFFGIWGNFGFFWYVWNWTPSMDLPEKYIQFDIHHLYVTNKFLDQKYS